MVGWLLEAAAPGSVVTPERLSDEDRLIGRTAREFVEQEIRPAVPALERKDWDLARRLVRRCGELGLLGVDVPEAYGGVDLDKVASLIVSEQLAGSASFGATFGAQTVLAIMALVLFGTDAQKAQYLTRLVSGEIIGAYGLSESGSGSDALGAKTRATREGDGSYRLSGEKMWITNGGFADLFVIFAKVDGELFTAFLVERAFPGLASGKEEHKMGLHGSSTTPILLDRVPVPAANVLGEVGRGHKVAFNVLNFARFKLGAGCSGGARQAIGEAAQYAAERRQFGQPIAGFGAIRHKLGEMVAREYAVESLLYRTAGLIDARRSVGGGSAAATLAAFEEYAIESSIAKVAGSEMLGFVLDENVQIHGGNGYVTDYPAERHYRDARVNRIFEGTNEINRLLIPGLIARRAAKGDLPLAEAARSVQAALSGQTATPTPPPGTLGGERSLLEGCKKAAILVLGTAMRTYGEALGDEQEVLMSVADMLIDTYAGESALLRATAAVDRGVPKAPLHANAARVYVDGAVVRIEAAARQALGAMVEGDSLTQLTGAVACLTRVAPANTVALRRRLADEAVTGGGYPFAN
jgi:alkylation response protein AidB-like acyl-CoA dehydrogenase